MPHAQKATHYTSTRGLLLFNLFLGLLWCFKELHRRLRHGPSELLQAQRPKWGILSLWPYHRWAFYGSVQESKASGFRASLFIYFCLGLDMTGCASCVAKHSGIPYGSVLGVVLCILLLG